MPNTVLKTVILALSTQVEEIISTECTNIFELKKKKKNVLIQNAVEIG